MPTRILVVGLGAIGGFYASRLACAPNTTISALCRSNYKAVKSKGLRVLSLQYGDSTFSLHHTFRDADEIRKASIEWDYIVVATKALPDVGDDSKLLEGLACPRSSIVLIQNGLGVEEPYLKRFPRNCILSAVTNASVAQLEHGVMKHNRWTKIAVGPYLPSGLGASRTKDAEELAMQKASRFVELLRAGAVEDAEVADHAGLQFIRWHKVAINCAMNPSSVLSGGSTNQEMVTDPEFAHHLLQVMSEVLETAPKVLNKPLPDRLATPEQVLSSIRKETGGSRPSMLNDWEMGRPMEIEVILGNPLRLAREKGIEMPRLQTMYALLKKAQQQRQRRKASSL